ncbi:AAA family ATPase [Lysinibacillus sp. 1P01SD]|uniref:AAA family ATPase n=1 Tax=Lysinibacillus sp. 1P01SD TaxID=3132285 RepID=UPI0039A2A614
MKTTQWRFYIMSNVNLIVQIMNALNNKYVQREKEIEAVFLGLLSRQHVLLIGSAGTSKSALIMDIANSIQDANYFQWLLTKFTKEEELFGSLNLDSLENGVYERNTTYKLPQANTAFLDEIFKSNSAILNSLLTMLNERLYYNYSSPIEVPLSTLIGASNEYPEDDSLIALFDRFLLRREVEYIKEDKDFERMLVIDGDAIQIPTITLSELENMQYLCSLVTIPNDIIQNLVRIRADLKNEGIQPSDRRYKQSLSILKAKAFLAGRIVVELDDLEILTDILWEEISQKPKVESIIQKLDVVTYEIKELVSVMVDLREEGGKINQETDLKRRSEILLDLVKKASDISKELESLKVKYSNIWNDEYSQAVQHECENIQRFKETLAQQMTVVAE